MCVWRKSSFFMWLLASCNWHLPGCAWQQLPVWDVPRQVRHAPAKQAFRGACKIPARCWGGCNAPCPWSFCFKDSMPLSQLTENLFFVLFLHHYNRTVNTENLHSILHFPCFRDSGANCVIKEVNAAFCLPALVVLQHSVFRLKHQICSHSQSMKNKLSSHPSVCSCENIN